MLPSSRSHQLAHVESQKVAVTDSQPMQISFGEDDETPRYEEETKGECGEKGPEPTVISEPALDLI